MTNHLLSLSGQGGVGKTAAMKRIAQRWARRESPELEKFDFVFYIALRNLSKGKTIEEIIIAEHKGLKADNRVSSKEIKSLLCDKNKHQVLLLLDGYDEYKQGTNPYIDQIISRESLQDCWVVLTSRENDHFHTVRQHMDIVSEIKGLNEKRTAIYDKIAAKSIAREGLRRGSGARNKNAHKTLKTHQEMLKNLGKLAWNGLKKETLVFERVGIKHCCQKTSGLNLVILEFNGFSQINYQMSFLECYNLFISGSGFTRCSGTWAFV